MILVPIFERLVIRIHPEFQLKSMAHCFLLTLGWESTTSHNVRSDAKTKPCLESLGKESSFKSSSICLGGRKYGVQSRLP